MRSRFGGRDRQRFGHHREQRRGIHNGVDIGGVEQSETTSDESESESTTDDGTTGPFVPCTDDLPLRQVFARIRIDQSLFVSDTGCVTCQCFDSQCTWWASGIPQEPGTYSLGAEIEGMCPFCVGGPDNGEESGTFDQEGTVEIVSIDESGVTGCVIGTCADDFRFEATWCPP